MRPSADELGHPGTARARHPARRAIGLAALPCLLALAPACTTTTQGEFTALQCDDRIDNDGDGLVDCLDRDCEAWTWCAPGHQEPGPRPDAGGGTGGLSSDAAPPACERPPCDAATPPERPLYAIRPIQGRVPDFFAERLLCYDFCSVVPDRDCRCLPDPYVEIRLRGQVLGTSEVIEDTVTPKWTTGGVEVGLDPARDEGELLVVVFDEDEPEALNYVPDDIPEMDDELLRCRPDLTELGTGMLDCRVPGTALGLTLEVIALD